MHTAAQRHHAAEAARVITDALDTLPDDHRAGFFYALAADYFSDEQCEELSNRLGRVPGERRRNAA
jgi:DNA-directed RNA polymerase specialized sigma24 family protein